MEKDEILLNPAFHHTAAHDVDDAEVKKIFRDNPKDLAIIAPNRTVFRDEFFGK
jgi:hypothetical protein